MNKPFKGMISNWSLTGGRIEGTCVFHKDYSNDIERDLPMTTSIVLHIACVKGVTLVETKNSYYILVP